jgi:recombination associated protein RdgC
VFKNLQLLRIAADWLPDAIAAEDALAREPFTPCGATQPASAGWVPPRGVPHAPLLECVGGHWLMALMTERKLLPGSVVADKASEIAAQLEQERGYKVGKREQKEIKERATLELLPLAFKKRSLTRIWIDPRARLLVIDTGSASAADGVVSMLVKALDGFAVAPLATWTSPAAAMASWIAEGEAPSGFQLDRECELKSADEMRSVVRYARHALDNDDVKHHIASGKRPTRLALSWGDRVAFTLTDGLLLKKVEILDVALEGRGAVPDEEAFDADAAIACGELSRLIPDLLEALGGEAEQRQIAEEPQHDSVQIGNVTVTATSSVNELGAFQGDADPLYDQAVAIVREHKRASISLVQRYLRIGYNRAAMLLEAMESAGIVSAISSSGQRLIISAGEPA